MEVEKIILKLQRRATELQRMKALAFREVDISLRAGDKEGAEICKDIAREYHNRLEEVYSLARLLGVVLK